jgi:hypothetical protein
MSTKHWIKQPIAVLFDERLGRLSDRLFRRYTQLRLFAGQLNQGGALPRLEQICWTVRVTLPRLLKELAALAELGLAAETADGWHLPGFAEEQAAETPAERQQRFRQHNGSQNARYTPVTRASSPPRAALPDKEEEIEKESEPDPDPKEEGNREKESEPHAKREAEGEEEGEEEGDAQARNPSSALLLSRCGSKKFLGNAPKTPETSADPPLPADIPDPAFAARVFCAATGMATIPPTIRETACSLIHSLRERFPEEADLVGYLIPVYARWCNTYNKAGKNYSSLSHGWLEWALAESATPPPSGIRRKTRSGMEIYTDAEMELLRKALNDDDPG